MTTETLRLVRFRPRSDAACISQGRTILVAGRDGFLTGDNGQGLFVHQTRLLSRYRCLVDGTPPDPVALANVAQHSWLGYYVVPVSAGRSRGETATPSSEHVVEVRLSRFVGEGLHEDVDLTNFTQQPVRLELVLEVEADFADQKEVKEKRRQRGTLEQAWRQAGSAAWELAVDYRASHRYDHQGNRGTARIHRGFTFRVERASSPPSYHDGRLSFSVRLAPRESWHACLSLVPFIDGRPLPLLYSCCSFGGESSEYDRKRGAFLAEATRFAGPQDGTLTPVVLAALEQARHDLAALRLYDLDGDDGGWAPAAGLPTYVALFGRDVLMTGWLAGLLGPELLRGALGVLPPTQGTEINDWRDEQPGRMIHQVQDSPLSALNFNPLGRYYGTMSSPVFYCEALYGLWLWTGSEEQVRPFLEPALRALRWLDEYGDLDGDGFYEYQTRSEQGLKNQCWKDSGEAIVYEDGSQVPAPIATMEMQALAYVAKMHLAQVLYDLDRHDEARALVRAARELKKRFNDTFWMDDEDSFAMGLDPDKRLIRSVCSDPGACLAAAIADDSLVRRTADRLLADDLFSGWGVRTLSARHPAYNPFSYQRGAVWPVENAVVALGFQRYGLHEHVERLCRAQFEAASLFEYYRLPEVFAGHPRDGDHPFPGLYPQANWPQAWSSAALVSLVQALLGIFPFAPLHVLVVDPRLPAWLPEITLENLRLGDGAVSLRFWRGKDGTSSYRVLQKRGRLHIVRQPSPWSLTASAGERLKDALLSLLPGK